MLHHMFSYLSPEQRVPADHPLCAVRALTDHALKTMSSTSEGSDIMRGHDEQTAGSTDALSWRTGWATGAT